MVPCVHGRNDLPMISNGIKKIHRDTDAGKNDESEKGNNMQPFL